MAPRDLLVQATGYAFAVAFAIVGLLFLVVPGDVLTTLDRLGAGFHLAAAQPAGHGFYLMLAVAYMYVVTVLATLMARHPGNPAYATLLVHAKAASALLSIGLFAVQQHLFVYLANFAVDGAIALFVYWLCVRFALNATEAEAASTA